MLHLSAERDELIGFVNTASDFVVEHQGTHSHLKGILIVADAESNVVTFTAENETSAVDFSTDQIKVESSGAILVDASRLRSALSVMGNSQPVTLEQMKGGDPKHPGKRLHIFSADTKVDLIIQNVDLSDERELVPTIGEPQPENIVLLAREFAEAHAQGSVAFAGTDSIGIRDVLFETLDNGLRIGSMRKNGSLSYSIAPTLGSAEFTALFTPSVLGKLAGYAATSDLIELAYGDRERTEIHMTTYRFIPPAKTKKPNAKKEEAYAELIENPGESADYEIALHLRFALSASDASKHPMKGGESRVLAGVSEFIKRLSGTANVSREDFFDLMDRAERMRKVNVEVGNNRAFIEMSIKDGQLRAATSGESPFSDQIAIHSSSGEIADLEFAINWNLYSSIYGTYPQRDLFPLHILAQGGNVRAVLMYDEEDLDESTGIPKTYLAVAPTAKSE